MGISLKAVLVMSAAIIALNYIRGYLDKQKWMPEMLVRKDGLGLDDVLDGAVLVAVLYGIHKIV